MDMNINYSDFDKFKRTVEEDVLEYIKYYIKVLKSDEGRDYRASEEDYEPTITIIIGADSDLQGYGLQSGDASFYGAAYDYPYWGVITVNGSSSPKESFDELMRELEHSIFN